VICVVIIEYLVYAPTVQYEVIKQAGIRALRKTIGYRAGALSTITVRPTPSQAQYGSVVYIACGNLRRFLLYRCGGSDGLSL
jgi:hypothetical protein